MKKNIGRFKIAEKITKEMQCEKLKYSLITKNITLQIINKFLKEIENSIINGFTVELRNFGVISLVTRKEKIGRNFHDKNCNITIPSKKTIKFKVSKKLENRLGKVKNEI